MITNWYTQWSIFIWHAQINTSTWHTSTSYFSRGTNQLSFRAGHKVIGCRLPIYPKHDIMKSFTSFILFASKMKQCVFCFLIELSIMKIVCNRKKQSKRINLKRYDTTAVKASCNVVSGIAYAIHSNLHWITFWLKCRTVFQKKKIDGIQNVTYYGNLQRSKW